jgi:glycosyltransferase involved in cell wall biosynthesis
MTKKSKKILILGFGIDRRRTEAVSLNTLKTVAVLKKAGFTPVVYNIGYKNPFSDTGTSMWQALFKREQIISDLIQFIDKNQITHVHDVFVLPLSTVIFTLQLKKKRPLLSLIKEIHNDAGFSKKLHSETIIRILASNHYWLSKLLSSCTCYTRNKYLADKYHLRYIPLYVNYSALLRKKSAKVRIGYLGHPLPKKGVWEFPKLIELLASDKKNAYLLSFAFSSIGDESAIKKEISATATRVGIPVLFKKKVIPHDFFADQDFYILPIHDEYGAISTPNTILEAMEAEAIPIVTKISSLIGIVSHNRTGIFIEQPRAEDIFRSLKKVVSKPVLTAEMRKKGRLFIKSHFSEKIVMEKFRKLYEN